MLGGVARRAIFSFFLNSLTVCLAIITLYAFYIHFFEEVQRSDGNPIEVLLAVNLMLVNFA